MEHRAGAVGYGAQLVPPNFSHKVSFSRRQFSLARLFFFRHDFFFFGTTFFLARLFPGLFFSARLFFLARLFFRHDFLFSARPGQVTADQYYYSGMEHMVIPTVVQILGTRLPRLFLLNTSRHAQFVTPAS